jgi:hypothetical protein
LGEFFQLKTPPHAPPQWNNTKKIQTLPKHNYVAFAINNKPNAKK